MPTAAPVLTAEHLTSRVLRDVSFHIGEGEVVGFYGLVGAGKTEIARALFGADRVLRRHRVQGAATRPFAQGCDRSGIALVPEERRTQGLFTRLTIRRNIPVMNMRRLSHAWRHPVVRRAGGRGQDTSRSCRISTDSIEKSVDKLSGGNQQKVVLSKCLFADADLLLLDEPTRGVDVGAKAEIYDIIRSLADEGTSVAVFSSELEEVLGICDRIFLLFAGSLKDEVVNGPDVDTARILDVVTGGARAVTRR